MATPKLVRNTAVARVNHKRNPFHPFSTLDTVTLAAMAYKYSIGQPFLYPDNSLTLVENFLRMTFGFPAEPYEVDPEVAAALDMLLILHADHEQNCSTSTVRVVGSSRANLFSSVAAGVCALWGPLHGGANQAVIEMLEQIHATGDDGSRFSEAFITTTLLYCVGAMAVVGSLNSGLTGNHEVLFTKSILDGVSAIIFASTLGAGALAIEASA